MAMQMSRVPNTVNAVVPMPPVTGNSTPEAFPRAAASVLPSADALNGNTTNSGTLIAGIGTGEQCQGILSR